MREVAIIENSPDLGDHFTRYMDPTAYEIFAVWKHPIFPEDTFHSYIITGDQNNISDGLLPYHKMLKDFIKKIEKKRIFASCFAHQLLADIYGGRSGRRAVRFLGWQRMDLLEEHPVFKGLRDAYFLCLNGDEVVRKPDGVRLLATHPKCPFQVLLYGDNILTCQSHPEIFKGEGLSMLFENRDRLSDRAPEFDDVVKRTFKWSDDRQSELFLRNLTEWLFEEY